MKKIYSSPEMFLTMFETAEKIMDQGHDFGSDIIPDPFNTVGGYDLPYANPNGTVVNNNGAPTFVPGGNGGGGRQTPLG